MKQRAELVILRESMEMRNVVKYPGLKQNEVQLWEAFLVNDAVKLPIIGTFFDCVVGGWIEDKAETTPQKDWETLQRYRLRIDVVLEMPSEIMILEIAPKVGKCEYGGLFLYRFALVRDFQLNNPVPVKIQGNKKWQAAPTSWVNKNITLGVICLYTREVYRQYFTEAGIRMFEERVPDLENKIIR